MNLNRLQKGFTLIELMVVLTISAIIAAIAIPRMQGIVAEQRVQNRTDQLWALLQFSRAEALRTNKPVLVCPTTLRKDSSQTNGCSNWGGSWKGLLAFSDNNLNGTYTANNDTLLRSVFFNPPNGGDIQVRREICTNNQCSSTNLSGNNQLGFLPDGRFGWGNGGTWTFGTASVRFRIQDRNKNNISRTIVISPGGKAIVCPLSVTESTNLPANCNTPQ